MPNCKFCGRPSGFMKWWHKECRQKHDLAVGKIPTAFARFIETDFPPEVFHKNTIDFARQNWVSEKRLKSLVLKGFGAAIDHALSDHLLTAKEEQKIGQLLKAFNLSVDDLPVTDGQRLVKSAILRDLDEGRVPDRLKFSERLSLNLRSDEKIIWMFQGVSYLTMRTQTTYVGRSHGVSVRLMRGVYYRVGASRAQPIKTDFMSEEGTGILAVSNLAIYFLSSPKVRKIPAKKIIAVEGFSDGISVSLDSVNAKPQFFKLDDPWFAANVITRLNQL